jgi:hypothetical protein
MMRTCRGEQRRRRPDGRESFLFGVLDDRRFPAGKSSRGKLLSMTQHEFEVTLLTTRCGTTTVRVTAADRDEVRRVIYVEISTGEHIAPPEYCPDDIQTEICAIREIHA